MCFSSLQTLLTLNLHVWYHVVGWLWRSFCFSKRSEPQEWVPKLRMCLAWLYHRQAGENFFEALAWSSFISFGTASFPTPWPRHASPQLTIFLSLVPAVSHANWIHSIHKRNRVKQPIFPLKQNLSSTPPMHQLLFLLRPAQNLHGYWLG